MSGGRRKYNIWIAYSDLFTNLSAFLFISAIGLFAAFGGGIAANIAPGACSVPSTATHTPAAGGGLISRIGAPTPAELDCIQHYQIGDFRFQSKWAFPASFRAARQSSRQLNMLSQICEPIWQTIARRDFRDHGGRLIFRGIGASTNDWQSQPQCKRRLRDEPRLMLAGMPSGIPQMEAVSRCRRNARAHDACGTILECSRPQSPRRAACRRVVALLSWDERMSRACHAQTVREQAHALYRICERAPSDENFQDQIYDDREIYVDEARREDLRGSLWESVDYGAYVVPSNGAARSSDRSLVHLNALPAGTVVLEVQYTR